MDKDQLKFFEEIKEKANQDKLIWNKVQEDESATLSRETENQMMERMFLVHYVDEYLEGLNRIKELEEQLSEAEGAICSYRND